MATIQEIFKAALNATIKDDWGAQTNIGKLTRLTPQKINKFLTGELKNGLEDDRRAIASALGYNYEAFLDAGRRTLGLPTTSASKEAPPSPEVAAYLGKARKALEGPKANMVKDLIDLIEP